MSETESQMGPDNVTADETSDQREKREEQVALIKLLLVLENDATDVGAPVNSSVRNVPFTVKLEDESTEEYLLRINPAHIDANGRIFVTVLDMYQLFELEAEGEDGDEEEETQLTHTQQWVLLSDWNKIPVVKPDKTLINPDLTLFRLSQIADIATNYLTSEAAQKKAATESNRPALRMPNSYARGTN